VIWGTVALAVALFAGAFIIWLVDRWRKRLGQQQAAFDELSEYRQMLENGEITEEEYQRLRASVPPHPFWASVLTECECFPSNSHATLHAAPTAHRRSQFRRSSLTVSTAHGTKGTIVMK
jgi:hypothetical protein